VELVAGALILKVRTGPGEEYSLKYFYRSKLGGMGWKRGTVEARTKGAPM